jgi:hypothetical protein
MMAGGRWNAGFNHFAEFWGSLLGHCLYHNTMRFPKKKEINLNVIAAHKNACIYHCLTGISSEPSALQIVSPATAELCEDYSHK